MTRQNINKLLLCSRYSTNSAFRKEFKNGGNGWQVFVEGMEGNLRCEMNFREPLKAMRYMFGLSKQLGVQVNKVSLAALSIEYQTAKAQTESYEGADNTSEAESSDEDSAPAVYNEDTRAHDKFLVFQYEDLKKKHPDAILLFRCGDFYEIYDEDAKLLKRKFRFEKSFEFDNFSICIPQERFSEVISYLALNGFRIAVKTRVPD